MFSKHERRAGSEPDLTKKVIAIFAGRDLQRCFPTHLCQRGILRRQGPNELTRRCTSMQISFDRTFCLTRVKLVYSIVLDIVKMASELSS